MSRREEREAAHQLQQLGFKIVKAPSRRGMKSVPKAFKDLEHGDLHDMGTVDHIELDPHPRGREGWVVFDDGTRTSSGGMDRVWIPDNHQPVRES